MGYDHFSRFRTCFWSVYCQTVYVTACVITIEWRVQKRDWLIRLISCIFDCIWQWCYQRHSRPVRQRLGQINAEDIMQCSSELVKFLYQHGTHTDGSFMNLYIIVPSSSYELMVDRYRKSLNRPVNLDTLCYYPNQCKDTLVVIWQDMGQLLLISSTQTLFNIQDSIPSSELEQ